MKDFSIIIPTYKDWDRLSLCIDCLVNQNVNGIEFEIIVVDNETDHNPPRHIENLSVKNLKIIHEPNPGSYSARNSGAKFADGTYLAFTDSDCLPDKRWLTNAKKMFVKLNCDLIGGEIDLFKPDGGSNYAFIFEKHTSFRQQDTVKNGQSVTANMLVKREVYQTLNGFNCSLKSGGDWEFSDRAAENNYTMCFGEDVVVKHPARKSVLHILKKQKRFAAWGYLNVKNKYGHSGMRIICSNLLRGTQSVFKSLKIPKKSHEKIIVLSISLQIHFYKVMLQILFFLKIMNPEEIRE